MKNLLLGTIIATLFSGCAVDTLYLTGEAVGKKVLPKEIKEKIRPYNEAIKDGYKIYKKGNDASSLSEKNISK